MAVIGQRILNESKTDAKGMRDMQKDKTHPHCTPKNYQIKCFHELPMRDKWVFDFDAVTI